MSVPSLFVRALFACVLVVGCASEEELTPEDLAIFAGEGSGGTPAGNGGIPVGNGATPAGSGGFPTSSGGLPTSTGGAPAATGGRSPANGGALSTGGGQPSTGGQSGNGGTVGASCNQNSDCKNSCLIAVPCCNAQKTCGCDVTLIGILCF